MGGEGPGGTRWCSSCGGLPPAERTPKDPPGRVVVGVISGQLGNQGTGGAPSSQGSSTPGSQAPWQLHAPQSQAPDSPIPPTFTFQNHQQSHRQDRERQDEPHGWAGPRALWRERWGGVISGASPLPPRFLPPFLVLLVCGGSLWGAEHQPDSVAGQQRVAGPRLAWPLWSGAGAGQVPLPPPGPPLVPASLCQTPSPRTSRTPLAGGDGRQVGHR